MTGCLVPGCVKAPQKKGLCEMHYMRERRTGSVHTVRPPGVPGSSRKHQLYGAWGGMVNRCHNPNNSSYQRYGALGITVCDRWRYGDGNKSGFECYLHDMGERPDGMTLDRINPKGPYAPENCRWATVAEQRANLSPEGDSRMRKAVSDGVKRRWANLRAAQNAAS